MLRGEISNDPYGAAINSATDWALSESRLEYCIICVIYVTEPSQKTYD